MGSFATDNLLSAVTRLVGAPDRKARHAWFFRLEITSKDGKRCAVPLMVSSHRRKGNVTRSVLNNVADALLIDRKDIMKVLETWTSEQLRAHLSAHTAEELKPRSLRGR